MPCGGGRGELDGEGCIDWWQRGNCRVLGGVLLLLLRIIFAVIFFMVSRLASGGERLHALHVTSWALSN